jgi:hypothetical protein
MDMVCKSLRHLLYIYLVHFVQLILVFAYPKQTEEISEILNRHNTLREANVDLMQHSALVRFYHAVLSLVVLVDIGV